MRYHCTTESTESLSIVVKPFNSVDAMGRNVNKQSQICGPDIFTNTFFSVIFLYAWITIFGSFFHINGSRFRCLNIVKNVRWKQFWPKRYRNSIFNKPVWRIHSFLHSVFLVWGMLLYDKHDLIEFRLVGYQCPLQRPYYQSNIGYLFVLKWAIWDIWSIPVSFEQNC